MRIRIGSVIETLVDLGDRYNLAAKSISEKIE